MTETGVIALFQTLQLDERSPTPLYLQLKHRLQALLDRGLLAAGEAMPGERDLARSIGISRVTVRRAINELVSEGLLVQRQGSGTFIAPRIEQPLSLLTGFSDDMRGRGLTPGAVWIERVATLSTPEEAMALNLSPGSKVLRLARIRTADGQPMALERATIPAALLARPEAVGDSLYAALRAHGVQPARALQRLRAELATAEAAELLGLAAGSPVLAIERRGFDTEGRPIEFTRSLYRADRYDFVAELRTEINGR